MIEVLATIILVFLGGGIGSSLRWGVGKAVGKRYHGSFPWGNFAVNITGSFLIGFLATLFLIDWDNWYGTIMIALVITGLLGGYTTFSSYELDTAKLIGKKKTGIAATYWIGSVVAGLIAALAGIFLAGVIR